MSEYLPDLSMIPDSETKRRVLGLSEEYELLIDRLGTVKLSEAEFQRTHSDASKVYWEMNALVGKLYEQERNRKSDSMKHYLSTIFSGMALIISFVALMKG